MPSINSMIQRNDMVANVSYRYFKLDSEAAKDSILVNAPIEINKNFLKSDFGGQPALTTLVENYNADKDDFQSKMQDRLDSLQESSDKLKDSVQEDSETQSGEEKSTRSNFAKHGDLTKDNVSSRAKILPFKPKQNNDDDKKSEEILQQAKKVREQKAAEEIKKSERDSFKEFAENYLVAEDKKSDEQEKETSTKEDSKIVSIQDFVRNYNSTLSYLNEKRGMSNRISALASNFDKNNDFSRSLNEIGISVNNLGELSVDEDELTSALKNDSENVGVLLGSEGLAGQLDKTVNLANYQSENLFPTIEEYSGEDKRKSWEQLYSAQTTNTANYARKNAGNILNMFT